MDLMYVQTFITAIIAAASVGLYQFFKRAVKRELEEVVENMIKPELTEIHKRIDETHARIDNHMESEEADIKALIRILAILADVPESEIKDELSK